jgi:uncharacterized membrane protein
MRLLEFSLLLTSLICSSFGQVALQHGMNKVGAVASLARLLHALTTPHVILGLALYALGAMFWLTVLSRVRELSMVYPMISLSYVFVVFLSWLIFHDPITMLKVWGIALIVVGVACVGLS